MSSLERELYKDMINIYNQTDKQCNYRPTRFIQVLEANGPKAAKQLN